MVRMNCNLHCATHVQTMFLADPVVAELLFTSLVTVPWCIFMYVAVLNSHLAFGA